MLKNNNSRYILVWGVVGCGGFWGVEVFLFFKFLLFNLESYFGCCLVMSSGAHGYLSLHSLLIKLCFGY